MTDVPREDKKPAPAETVKLRVFISYSREDIGFADQLVAALTTCGFAPTMDVHAIDGGEAWQQRLGALILEADTVVFVLSPASAASPMCQWEVGEALRRSKRILPVVARPLGAVSPPQALMDLNYIFFYAEPKAPNSGFGVGLAELVETLNTDRGWIRQHTRLLERATEWDVGGRQTSRLLSGTDITEAKAWAAQRPRGAPEPTELHLDYIRASEVEEGRRVSAEHQRLKDMEAAQEERAKALREAEDALQAKAQAQRESARLWKRMTIGAGVVGVCLAMIAGAAVWQWREAVVQRRDAQANLKEAQIARARNLLARAERAAIIGDHTTATLLAIEAWTDPSNPNRPRVFEATAALSKYADDARRERAVFDGPATLSADGRFVLSRPLSGAPHLSDASSGKLLLVLGPAKEVAETADLNKGGDRVLVRAKDQWPRLWNTETLAELPLEAAARPPAVKKASFSPDGRVVALLADGEPARLWDSATGRALFALGDAEDAASDVVFSPDGALAVPLSDNHLRLWTLPTRQFRELPAKGPFQDVQFSRNGFRLGTRTADGRMQIWDTLSGRELSHPDLPIEEVEEATFSPDGAVLLVRASGRPPELWDTATGTKSASLGGTPANAWFSPNGHYVLTQIDTQPPLLWDATTGDFRFPLQDQSGVVTSAVFSPDSEFVLTVSGRRDVALWSVAAGSVQYELDVAEVVSAFFAPNGRVLTVSEQPDGPADVATIRYWSRAPAGTRAARLRYQRRVPVAPRSRATVLEQRFWAAADAHRPKLVTFGPKGDIALTVPENLDGTSHLWELWEVGDVTDEETSGDAATAVVERAKKAVARCLTIDQRKGYLLRPQPPDWCVDQAKPPYDVEAWRTKGAVDEALAEKYGDFAHSFLKEGDGLNALEATELSKRFDPGLVWPNVNRAHALMFLGETDRSMRLHQANCGRRLYRDTSNPKTWDEGVRDDFQEYRDRGHEHPFMVEIEATLSGPACKRNATDGPSIPSP